LQHHLKTLPAIAEPDAVDTAMSIQQYRMSSHSSSVYATNQQRLSGSLTIQISNTTEKGLRAIVAPRSINRVFLSCGDSQLSLRTCRPETCGNAAGLGERILHVG